MEDTMADNGQYMVYGSVPLVRKSEVISEHGEPLTWRTDEVLQTGERYMRCADAVSPVPNRSAMGLMLT